MASTLVSISRGLSPQWCIRARCKLSHVIIGVRASNGSSEVRSQVGRFSSRSFALSGTQQSRQMGRSWNALRSARTYEMSASYRKRAPILGLGSSLIRTSFDDRAIHCRRNQKLQQKQSADVRCFSSRTGGRTKKFQLDGLPFTISPEEALAKFQSWAENDQGLGYLMNYQSVRIGAAYAPVWSFDINIRFVRVDANNRKQATAWKPQMFADAYRSTNDSVIHLAGLSSYAGYSYRRSLIHPVHNTTLVFLGDETQPFGSWMLREMQLQSTGDSIAVTPDAWNATRAGAFRNLKAELQLLAEADWAAENGSDGSNISIQVQTEVVKSRRVYMPTYVLDYSIVGLEYRAFVSGCDQGSPVSGPSHQVMTDDAAASFRISPEMSRTGQGALGSMMRASPLTLARNARILSTILRPLGPFFAMLFVRFAAMIPIVGVLGGVFTGFRKVIQPWMERRSESAEWERQREAEAQGSSTESLMNDFSDTMGRAQQFYDRNKRDILSSLSGEARHEEGDYDWYKDWEEWARQQWSKQAQQQQQDFWQQQQQQQQNQQKSSYSGQSTRRGRQQKAKAKPEYQWDFDPNDPYSVLNVPRGSSKTDVSAAFRREMLKHHPDTQPNATEAQKQRSVERSKYITEAYRKIKSQQKR